MIWHISPTRWVRDNPITGAHLTDATGVLRVDLYGSVHYLSPYNAFQHNVLVATTDDPADVAEYGFPGVAQELEQRLKARAERLSRGRSDDR